MKLGRSICGAGLIWGVALFTASAVAPNFADMAVVVAKGYFAKEISSTASLSECFQFLNKHGIEFSMFDLLDPSAAVGREDFARVIGQSTLLFLGEEQVVNGAIELPPDIESWLDYCALNDVNIEVLWGRLVERVRVGHLPEVTVFFESN